MDFLHDPMAGSIQIVVIDDNPGSLELLSTALARPGVEVLTAPSPTQGIDLVRAVRPQLVITDLVMPELSGLDVLDAIVAFDPLIDVVLMTAHYTTETAVAAIRKGAADYIQKPVKITLLRERISALLESAAQRRSAHNTPEAENDATFEGMTAHSPAMWDLFAKIQRIAPHFRTVLIHGPTGSGKDLVANALHHRSGVAGKLVVLNCSAVVETLFESELFGHVRGAFTGADRDKPGLLDSANNGTLFLDEIGDMSLPTQAKLLRVLQNQEFLPVGSLTPRKVSVRVIAASHKDLKALIAAGQFREDLYYRLSMVELDVPALKDHPEDILLLARTFLQRFSREFGRPIQGITPRAALLLERYAWPGNVRELEHVIGRACMLADGPTLDATDLPDTITQSEASTPAGPDSPTTLAENERTLIEEAMRACAGNQSEAARRLGIGRDALRYKLKRYNLSA